MAPLRAPFTALAARSNVSGYLCRVLDATILRLGGGGGRDGGGDRQAGRHMVTFFFGGEGRGWEGMEREERTVGRMARG